MMKRFKRLNNTGDTIVEVMIVLAVLGLALSISYATANRGLQQARNAQEHSQALGIIDTQVELLRSAFAKKAGGAIETQGGTGPFCLSPSGTVISITPLANSGLNKFNENIANDKLGNTTTYPSPCIQDTLYNVSIVGRGNGVYDFRVRWEGVGNLGRQQEELTYKIGNVIVAGTGGYTDPESPPPPPSLSLTLNANGDAPTTSVTAGTAVRMTWGTNPADASCTASGNWSGNKASSGNELLSATTVADIGHTFTYNLSCNSPQGGTDSKTVIVNVIGATYTFKGINYQSCQPTNSTSPCIPGSIPNSVANCQNYQVDYKAPAAIQAGNYALTINYQDASCGDPTPPAGSYTFSITVYVDGVKVNAPDCGNPNGRTCKKNPTLQLGPTGGNAGIDLGHLNTGSVVRIVWDNDQSVKVGFNSYDPDFQINTLILKQHP